MACSSWYIADVSSTGMYLDSAASKFPALQVFADDEGRRRGRFSSPPSTLGIRLRRHRHEVFVTGTEISPSGPVNANDLARPIGCNQGNCAVPDPQEIRERRADRSIRRCAEFSAYRCQLACNPLRGGSPATRMATSYPFFSARSTQRSVIVSRFWFPGSVKEKDSQRRGNMQGAKGHRSTDAQQSGAVVRSSTAFWPVRPRSASAMPDTVIAACCLRGVGECCTFPMALFFVVDRSRMRAC